jgi:hypothetical protein
MIQMSLRVIQDMKDARFRLSFSHSSREFTASFCTLQQRMLVFKQFTDHCTFGPDDCRAVIVHHAAVLRMPRRQILLIIVVWIIIIIMVPPSPPCMMLHHASPLRNYTKYVEPICCSGARGQFFTYIRTDFWFWSRVKMLMLYNRLAVLHLITI